MLKVLCGVTVQVAIVEGVQLLGLAYRMWNYTKREREQFRIPHMDPFAPKYRDAIMGVPLGGIGVYPCFLCFCEVSTTP